MIDEEISQIQDEISSTQAEETGDSEALDITHSKTSPIPVLPQLSIALFVLVFTFGVTYMGVSKSVAQKSATPDLRVEAALSKNSVDIKKNTVNAFDNTQLTAKSAFVWDVQKQKILFNKNGDEELPLASITKLMTALVTYELLDPGQKIHITNDSLKTSGDSGFADGEEFTMQNLTDLTLISSSNDGATALGAEAGRTISDQNPENVFIRAMNIKAKELGLTHTFYKNTTGLDLSETDAGSSGSAHDVALLMEHIIVHNADVTALTSLDVTTIPDKKGRYYLVKNTNESVNNIDGLIASKTGYTTLAGGNLVVAFNAGLNHPVIVVVLGSSQSGRFEDTVSLVEKTKKFIGDNQK